MESNIENIPKVEFKVGNEEHCTQLERRVICGRVGKGKFVKDSSQIDEANGSFEFIPQSDMEEFTNDPMTGALFLKYFGIPFF